MLDNKLNTFLKVAELGSFSRAADALFISPSAVIQQMNLLQSDLGVQLMSRSRVGVSLTPAGMLLQKEGTDLTAQVNGLLSRLHSIDNEALNEMKVGSSLLNQCRLFYSLWNLFTSQNDGYHAVIQEIHSQELWNHVDLFEGPFNPLFIRENDMEFFQLTTTPLVCGMGRDHPLAGKQVIRYEDFHGMKIINTGAGPDASEGVKKVFCKAVEHGAVLVNVSPNSTSLFDTCILNGYIINIPRCWAIVQPKLTTVTAEWNERVPYGFFYKSKASSAVTAFLSFVQTQLHTEYFE